MDALRSVLSSPTHSSTYSGDEETGILSGFEEVTRMSWSTRLKCFCACFLLGIIMSLLGTFVLFFNFGKGLPPFAAFYTLGNLFSIGRTVFAINMQNIDDSVCGSYLVIAFYFSTMFLVGPFKQLKNIFAPTRLIASIVMIITFVLTLVAAFVVKSALLALVMVIIQSLAMTWYSISYIPFARDFVTRVLGSIF